MNQVIYEDKWTQDNFGLKLGDFEFCELIEF